MCREIAIDFRPDPDKHVPVAVHIHWFPFCMLVSFSIVVGMFVIVGMLLYYSTSFRSRSRCLACLSHLCFFGFVFALMFALLSYSFA